MTATARNFKVFLFNSAYGELTPRYAREARTIPTLSSARRYARAKLARSSVKMVPYAEILTAKDLIKVEKVTRPEAAPAQQLNAFAATAADLPLFSGTAPAAETETYQPTEKPQQDSLFDLRPRM